MNFIKVVLGCSLKNHVVQVNPIVDDVHKRGDAAVKEWGLLSFFIELFSDIWCQSFIFNFFYKKVCYCFFILLNYPFASLVSLFLFTLTSISGTSVW